MGINTIAVVAGGLNTGFPKCNMAIYKQVLKQGLVLAEYPDNTEVNRYMFPKRNRILAGMSDTTIVIEAGIGSGSLITADLALEYNRDVYAIPGDIGRNTSLGCNMLIKQGANILTCLDDFKEILNIKNSQIYMSI